MNYTVHDKEVAKSILAYFSEKDLLSMQLVCTYWYNELVPFTFNSSCIANNRQNLTKCYSLMQRKFWAR